MPTSPPSTSTTSSNPSQERHIFSVWRVPSSASKLLVTLPDTQHTPIFYISPALYAGKEHKPDITLHRIRSDAWRSSQQDNPIDGHGRATARGEPDGRKLSPDTAKLEPVVATAHWRNTRKRIGLAFGDGMRQHVNTQSEVVGNNAKAAKKDPDAEQKSWTQSAGVHWETMHCHGNSKGRYTFTMPSREVLKRVGAIQAFGELVCGFENPFNGGNVDVSASAGHGHNTSRHSPDQKLDVGSADWWDDLPSPKQHKHLPADSTPGSSTPTTLTGTQRTVMHSHNTPEHGKTLTWKRTHNLASGLENAALYRIWSAANFKLVDDATGQIVAVFESNGLKSFRKLGRLKLARSEDIMEADGKHGVKGEEGVGQVDEALLLTAVLTWAVHWEQMRRER